MTQNISEFILFASIIEEWVFPSLVPITLPLLTSCTSPMPFLKDSFHIPLLTRLLPSTHRLLITSLPISAPTPKRVYLPSRCPLESPFWESQSPATSWKGKQSWRRKTSRITLDPQSPNFSSTEEWVPIWRPNLLCSELLHRLLSKAVHSLTSINSPEASLLLPPKSLHHLSFSPSQKNQWGRQKTPYRQLKSAPALLSSLFTKQYRSKIDNPGTAVSRPSWEDSLLLVSTEDPLSWKEEGKWGYLTSWLAHAKAVVGSGRSFWHFTGNQDGWWPWNGFRKRRFGQFSSSSLGKSSSSLIWNIQILSSFTVFFRSRSTFILFWNTWRKALFTDASEGRGVCLRKMFLRKSGTSARLSVSCTTLTFFTETSNRKISCWPM